MNQLSGPKQADILEDMMERKSLRGLARTMPGNSKLKRKGVSINTVYKLLEDAGDTAIQFLRSKMRDLPSTLVEADEVYCIVRMKPSTLRERRIRVPGLGAVWLWVAIDAEHRLIVDWHLGGSSRDDALTFMRSLSGRLPSRIQLTTDSLVSYPDAVGDAFDEIDYATVKKRDPDEEAARLAAELQGKEYRPPRRRRKAGLPTGEKELPHVHFGSPDLTKATTNHIEAFFAQLRKDLARMSRKTMLLSKNVQNLERTVALYIFHHNFVKIHSSLNGKTPAMSAGIDDDKWLWEDFVVLLDEFRAERRERKRLEQVRAVTPTEPVASDEAHEAGFDYCIYEQLRTRTSKIHRSSCRHLRTEPGREGKLGIGHKLYCETLQAARDRAEELTPARVTECRICLGDYNTKSYLGPKGSTSRPKLLS